jgi:predicted nuclease of restriction endonuclease-like (RecB) superfamily
MWQNDMKDFQQLIATIEQVHGHLQASAANAVNQALTIRNWLIGHYIVEFEQGGEDKAKYGERLLATMAAELRHIKGFDERSFRRFRQFYLTYPQISEALSDPFIRSLTVGALPQLLSNLTIRGTVSPESKGSSIRGTLSPESENQPTESILRPNSRESEPQEKVGSVTPQLPKKPQVPPDKLITRLSYSHLELLLNIDEPLKRTFYELECIKGTWSVRELKRQINSLYFERSGLSEKPEVLSELVRQKTTPQVPKDIIKNIYAFEFLGLSTKEILEESDIESALLDNLQGFIMELGNGFCLEARQKRILIGENYYFIDLVFYHRFLRCHILIELKLGAFDHNDIGQLNTYVNYYKLEIMQENENPPVGILLVADKDHALVKYATAGMDENLFIQEYLIRLPSKDQLESYIESELRKVR